MSVTEIARERLGSGCWDRRGSSRRGSYGDEWVFLVELVERAPRELKTKRPRLLSSVGKAPAQYPDPEDE